MSTAYVPDDEFIRIAENAKTANEAVQKCGYAEPSQFYARRRRLEQRYGINIGRWSTEQRANWPEIENEFFQQQKPFDLLVGSDRHALPNHRPQVVKLFLECAELIKPRVVVINGDWFDFPKLSRHNRTGWEQEPEPAEEIQDGMEILDELAKICARSERYFIRGNHDMRLDGKLSNTMPELEGMYGTSLSDHLQKKWKLSWSLSVNDTLMVKHRYKGGETAIKNNVQKSGKNIITGHDHTMKVWPYTDYTGTRYGMTSGTLSDPWAMPFMYAENNPRDWQAGFLVVHVDGPIVHPEPVYMVTDRYHKNWGTARFRGKWLGK